MIDPSEIKTVGQQIPVSDFICGHGRTGLDPLLRKENSLGFAQKGSRQRAAATLAQDNNHAALASAILQQPSIDPICSDVCRADVAAKIGAIDLNLTLKACFSRLLRHGASRSLCISINAVLYWMLRSRLN
jgi:hypothetical protein